METVLSIRHLLHNVIATISKLVIKDADGKTVFDSATGGLVPYIPAALVLRAAASV